MYETHTHTHTPLATAQLPLLCVCMFNVYLCQQNYTILNIYISLAMFRFCLDGMWKQLANIAYCKQVTASATLQLMALHRISYCGNTMRVNAFTLTTPAENTLVCIRIKLYCDSFFVIFYNLN